LLCEKHGVSSLTLMDVMCQI